MKKITIAAATALALVSATWLPSWIDRAPAIAPDPMDLGAASVDGGAADAAEPADSASARAAVAATATAFTLQGTIELRWKADGSLVDPGDGIAILQDAQTYETHRVEVRDGAFSLRLDGPTELFSSSVRLDEWNTSGGGILAKTRCSVDRPKIELVLEATTPSRLHVVDAATSTPLQNVDVVRSAFDEIEVPPVGDPGFPDGRHGIWVEGASSPFVVPSHDVTSGDYFVSAPGYAWQAVSLQHESGGERLVMLHPGGDLDVFVQHAPADLPPAFLRVRDATGRCIRERTWTHGTVDIGRLPVGEMTLGLEYGARDAPAGRRFAIATGTATITASGRARAVLDCAASGVTPPALDQRRDLEGTLTADPQWRTGYVRIHGRILALPLDRPALEGEIESTASGRWDEWKLGAPQAWCCKGLLPGRYRLVAVGFGMTHEIEVPSTGEMPVVDLVVPDPITCEVVATGVDDELERRVGSLLLLTELDGQRWIVAQGKAGDPARVRCVPGDYRLKAGLGEMDRRLSLRTDTRIELPREPRVGMHLEFHDGTAPVPVDPALVRFTHPDEEARVLLCADVGFMLSIHVNEPGTWRLQLDLPGYRPIDRELDFRGEYQRISVPLQRR